MNVDHAWDLEEHCKVKKIYGIPEKIRSYFIGSEIECEKGN